jgi:hypothetical protein
MIETNLFKLTLELKSKKSERTQEMSQRKEESIARGYI